MSLNFRDCHAKIRQVDSHATLGDGVVVQVTGELSNNGQPMRRFMQTFVLAPQSPKKYYVHNDIFRYQDEVFNDDEETDNLDASPVESEGEVEDERSESPPNAVDDMRDPAIASFYHSSSVTNGTVEEIPQPIQAVMKPEVEDIVENLENVTQAAPTSPMTPLSPEIQPSPPSPPQQQQQQQQQPVEEPQTTTPIQTMIENHTGSPTSTKDELQELETPKTLSWADRARQNSPMIVSAPNVVKQSPSQPGSPPSKEQNKITESGSGRAEPLPQRAPRQSGRGMGRGTPPNIGSDGAMSDQPIRSRPRHPDSHQVFVGNLPHDINEDELKNHFMAYGNVVEMRINTKSGGGKIPNFGFIVFDDPSPVQRILSEK
ncbi:ras GTPase-activating protein-binding protein 2-like, partial [Saccoglossus kowalevskii]